jgi:hypothetical protein
MKRNRVRESSSVVHSLLDSILESANKLSASSIHFYSQGEQISCFLKVAGKLVPTPKNINQKILSELLEFIKNSSKLDSSKISQIQRAQLKISQEVELSLTYLQNIHDSSSHLILHLAPRSNIQSFEELGFNSSNSAEIEESLSSGKGIILVDSLDQYTAREFIYSCLNFLKKESTAMSISFDSSLIPTVAINGHDRIYTKLNSSNYNLFTQALSSNPNIVIFFDPIDLKQLSFAIEASESGKLVLIVSAEGSSAASLKRAIALSPELTRLLSQLKLSVSLAPIQLIKEASVFHTLSEQSISKIENFFSIDLQDSWSYIHQLAGIKSPQDLLEIRFPIAPENPSGLTNLVEVLNLNDDIRRAILNNPNLSLEALHWLAVRSGMNSKRKDGLIKALQKKVDIADVIKITK